MTFSDLQQRYLDLIGDSDGLIDDFGKRNINSAIRDILNKYQFSWNITSDDITLSSGVADLPTNYNPAWNIVDARIGDNVFGQIPLCDIGRYSSDDYVFWVTYDATTNVYKFNSKIQSGTVTIFYNFIPSDLSLTTDVCFIPDKEAVSYLSASKNWIGAERDNDLRTVYQAEADKLITALWIRDIQNGPILNVGSVVGYDPDLTGV